jgi:hypothetical protein
MAIVRDLSGNSPQRDVDTHRTTTPEQTLSDIALTFDTLEDFTSLFVEIDGSGGNTSPGETVGLQLDKSHMGGMTAAAYIDSRPELGNVDLDSAVDGVFGSGGALPSGWYYTNVGVSIEVVKGDGYVDLILNGTASANGQIRWASDVPLATGELVRNVVTMTNPSGTSGTGILSRFISFETAANAYISGKFLDVPSPYDNDRPTWAVMVSAPDTAAYFNAGMFFAVGVYTNYVIRFHSVSAKIIPGQHRLASADNERPVLDRRPVSGRRNLLTYTEDFSSAAWSSNVATTVTENTDAAPDGTLSGDTVEATTTSQQFGRNASVTASSEYTFSLYVKHKNSRWLRVYLDNQSVWFDVENGLVGTNQLTGDADIVDIGGGWVRLTATHTAPDATMSVLFFLAAGDGSTAEVSGAQFGFWGAQLELGSTATPYQRVTNDNDITETGVRSVYSLEYDGADDGMSFDFEGGAGPADCSVFCVPDRSDTNNGGFFSSTTGSGFIGAMDGSTITDHHNLSGTIATFVDGTQLADERRNTLKVAVGNNQKKLVEFRNCNLSNWPGVMVADIFSAPYEYGGNIIGPIIVETSKLKQLPGMRQFIYNYLQTLVGERA